MLSAIKKRLSLKISITLVSIMLLLIVPVGALMIHSQMSSLEELTLEKAKLASSNGAEIYGTVLENVVESGLLTIDDVFDVEYEKITGYNWGASPKYHTNYDFFTDKATILFLDSLLINKDFIYAVGQDVNGYVPTHNSRYQQPVTDDPTKDLLGNQTKRMFKDPVSLRASQNETVGFHQRYNDEVGATLWDVSSPVYVKGRHWGCFRIGVSLKRVDKEKQSMLLLMLGLFGVFALLVSFTVFTLIKTAMKPIENLTAAAKRISLGKSLERRLRPETMDEIGALTKALDRLRVSMKAAMERLGE